VGTGPGSSATNDIDVTLAGNARVVVDDVTAVEAIPSFRPKRDLRIRPRNDLESS
jgi:hypothetical protein